MPVPSDDDDLNELWRQRTRDQVAPLKQAHGDTIIVDSDDDADFSFICSSEHVLVAPAVVGRLQEYLGRRRDDPDDDVFDDIGQIPDLQPSPLFSRYVLPTRRGAVPGDKSLLLTLDEMDRSDMLGPGVIRPDHLMHICPKGSLCPATEPTETGWTGPWPPVNVANPHAGQGVQVVVIDTGWYHPVAAANVPAPAQPWDWLAGVKGEPEPPPIFDAPPDQLRKYVGHGTFVAGVIRAMAPGCTVDVLSMPVDPASPGGGVLESDMVVKLGQALDLNPDIINLSAGCPTRLGHPALSFEVWWASLSAEVKQKLVVVAAAGNNSSPWSFWPASFDWATGVGSIDHNGDVSSFSNWGDSVDVYAVGRDLVNAFPLGSYVCHETPDKKSKRIFTNGLARWSGTSFSAPLVAGLIAADMTPPDDNPRSAPESRDRILHVPLPSRGDLQRVTVKVAPRARPSVPVRVASLP